VGVSSLFFIHPEPLEPEKDLGAVVVIASSSRSTSRAATGATAAEAGAAERKK